LKIGIVGPGAVGTFLAGLLGQENEVTLLGRKSLDIKDIEVVGKTEIKCSVDYTVSVSELADDELIIICTKSFDTDDAMRSISDHLSADSVVLSLQNGLNNEKVISSYVGEDRTIGGVTSNGVTFIEPGKVRHAGVGETVIGSYPRGHHESIDDVCEILNRAGIKTRTSSEIISHIWEKTIVNSAINPLTAVLDIKNGALIEDEFLEHLLEKIVSESVKVAEKQIDTSEDSLVSRTMEVADNTSDNYSSMLQDIRNKNKTEIEQINGEIIKIGGRSGVQTPINQTLFNLVKSKENRYLSG